MMPRSSRETSKNRLSFFAFVGFCLISLIGITVFLIAVERQVIENRSKIFSSATSIFVEDTYDDLSLIYDTSRMLSIIIKDPDTITFNQELWESCRQDSNFFRMV